MTFCPSGHCLCRTVQSESIRIWNDLQDAEMLNSPIHEDTITQTFALTLNRQHSRQNRVHLFGRAEEAKNGSDFLWLFFSDDLARHFRVAVQAKRLYPDGTYRAFKRSQALLIDRYAKSIDGLGVYAFYNFWPFRKGYYEFDGQKRFFRHCRIGFDHARDFGAIYVPVGDMLKLCKGALTPKHIAGVQLPLWHPFCQCTWTPAPTPIDALARRFTQWTDLGEEEAVGSQETSKILRQWMEAGAVEDGLLEEALRLRSGGPSEAFSPAFVMGTRLRRFSHGEAEI